MIVNSRIAGRITRYVAGDKKDGMYRRACLNNLQNNNIFLGKNEVFGVGVKDKKEVKNIACQCSQRQASSQKNKQISILNRYNTTTEV